MALEGGEWPNAPLPLLERWIQDARDAAQPHPASVAFVTATSTGRPSARTVTLKRIEADSLLVTTALWTRKAQELRENPHVTLLFHWAGMGRQTHIEGRARLGSRALSAELFSERARDHQYQTIVSRQGEMIEDLAPLRRRLEHLRLEDRSPTCPADWGAVAVTPHVVEFWEESPDRLHDRVLYEHQPLGDWQRVRLSRGSRS